MSVKHLHLQRVLTGFVLLLGTTLLSCSKSIAPTEFLTPLTPSAADANAGTWKMIVLTGPTQIPVAAPSATNDPGYLSELAAIKTEQTSITADQTTAITYWSAGGALRWNEILRELVARQDLPARAQPGRQLSLAQCSQPFCKSTVSV